MVHHADMFTEEGDPDGNIVKTGLYIPQALHSDVVVDGFVATTYYLYLSVKPDASHALFGPVRAAFQAIKLLLVTETSA